MKKKKSEKEKKAQKRSFKTPKHAHLELKVEIVKLAQLYWPPAVQRIGNSMEKEKEREDCREHTQI